MSNSELLVVLGKNIGVGSSREDIRRDPLHLSKESQMNALAAGLFLKSNTDMDVLFSTGKTAGPAFPSEASAMKAYLMDKYPDVPDDRLHTEEVSIDTAENAREVANWLTGRSYLWINLLTVSYHARNATKLFERNGVPISKTLESDKILGEQAEHQVFVHEWFGSDRIKKERQKEWVRSVLLATIDRRGKLLHAVTQRSRN